MYRWMISITFALLLSGAGASGNCSSQATESRLQNKDPQVLKEVEQEWLQAYGESNMRALDCILADDFEIGSMPDEKGEIHNKKHVLDWVAHRSPTTQKIEQLELKAYRDLVVVRGIYSSHRPDGTLLVRFQILDVFAQRGGRWQALTREIAELPTQSSP